MGELYRGTEKAPGRDGGMVGCRERGNEASNKAMREEESEVEGGDGKHSSEALARMHLFPSHSREREKLSSLAHLGDCERRGACS